VGQVNRVKSVKSKFTKRLPGYNSVDYKSRLRLHADSLELRRLICDLIYTYKVVFGLVNGAAIVTFSHSQVSSTPLVREVILTNFPLTVTVSTCTSIFFFAAYNGHMEQPAFKTE